MFHFLKEIDYRAPSVRSLIATNLALLVVAMILQWSVYEMVMVFWVENLVIGVFFIIKIYNAITEGSKIGFTSIFLGLAVCGFFCLHYMFFCFGHAVFIIALLGDGSLDGGPISGTLSAIDPLIFWISFGLLFISHGISYKTNFLDKGENRKVEMKDLMMGPYRRILLVQFFVLVCGVLFVIGFLFIEGRPNSLLFLPAFVLLKIVVDLRQHFI